MTVRDLFRTFRLLNLDVATGACLSSVYVSKLWGTEVVPDLIALLFIAVWSIYTIDRLMDNTYLKDLSTARHRFHRSFRKLLIPALILSLAGGLILLVKITLGRSYGSNVLENGIVLSVMVGLYLLTVHYRKGLVVKEPFIAAFYALGISIPALSLSPDLEINRVFVVVQFGLLALMNLSLFSLCERHSTDENRFNMMTHWNRTHIRVWFTLIFLFFGTIGVLRWLYHGFSGEDYILWVMGLGFLALFLGFRRDRPLERYKAVADSLFLLPGLIYFFW